MEGLNLHAARVRWLARSRTAKGRCLEAVLLEVHVTGYLGGVAWVLSPVHAVVFVAVHQALFGGYLGCSFAPTTRAADSRPAGEAGLLAPAGAGPPATSAAAGWSINCSAG